MKGRFRCESSSGRLSEEEVTEVTDEERFDAAETADEATEEGDVEGHRLKHDDSDAPEDERDAMKK
jgi:hypothetical protein